MAAGKAVYPFTAVVGQEQAKTALLINAVNPRAGGVLIAGEKGTAKSTLVRGLAALLEGTKLVELPLNATEDRVAGTIDFKYAMASGRKRFEPGLLAAADGHILYVDEINLLADSIANIVLDAAASGVNRVEREGVSHSHPARFILVGTMNPEEGSLSPQLLDRLGLSVKLAGEGNVADRREIIRRRLDYERDPVAFCRRYQAGTDALRREISQAQRLLPGIRIPEPMYALAAQIALAGNCAGHRADIFLVETARAICALAGRPEVTAADLSGAARYVLPHRLRRANGVAPPPAAASTGADGQGDKRASGERPEAAEPEAAISLGEGNESGPGRKNRAETEDARERYDEAGDAWPAPDFVLPPADRRLRKGSGRRSVTWTNTRQGRYVKFGLPRGKITDLALDATLRAAAPYQLIREKRDTFVVVAAADFRRKIRERRMGATILLVVDASGSMGARRRMRAVKSAVLGLLSEAYQKKDRVGMVVFRNRSAELVLGITRSVELAQKRLRALPTGGRTPLALGLRTGFDVLRLARLKDPDMLAVLVLVTDGKANAGLAGDPVQEALAAARRIGAAGMQSLVIDTENDYIRLGLARELAEAMGAHYCRLDELEAGRIVRAVQDISRRWYS